jgi:methionyl-tRNA formyltransferase
VKLAALELGLEVIQPTKVRDGSLAEWLRRKNADIAVVLAYGRILPTEVLGAPRLGCVNLHASLLPELRGAAPIQWAIIGGAKVTGFSLMQMEEGLDTGPVFAAQSLSIGPQETAGELTERMATLGAELLTAALPKVLHGQLQATPQDPSRATHAPPLTKEHGRLDWSQPALSLHSLVRGVTPSPGAHTLAQGKLLKIHRAEPEFPAGLEPRAPGTVQVLERRLLVHTGQGLLRVHQAQLEGRKAMSDVDLLNGRALTDGMQLGA